MSFDAIKLLKSQNAVVAVLVLALLAQMPHAASVFYHYSHAQNVWVSLQSIGFAVALEVAVLVFVARGSIQTSWGFAVFSIAINAVYYSDGSMSTLLSASSWPFWLLSAGLPVAIALYSHEVADDPHTVTVRNHAATEPLRVVAGNMQVVTGNMHIAAVERNSATEHCNDTAIEVAVPVAVDCSTAITERQAQILQLRSAGKTRGEIAALFGISLRTVDNEVKAARAVMVG
jgi:hypothetical protein